MLTRKTQDNIEIYLPSYYSKVDERWLMVQSIVLTYMYYSFCHFWIFVTVKIVCVELTVTYMRKKMVECWL